ncbi:MAG: LuxR C-terminal-related transcriptional regulator, partial [Anaerolineales bacterium]
MKKTIAPLTEREIEILKLVATGASNRQLAQHLHISSNTVKVHLRNIFEKLGVASRTEATLYAFQVGLVEGVETQVATTRRSWWQRGWVIAGGALVLTVLALLVGGLVNQTTAPPENLVDLEQLERDRWQELAPMPTARKGLAVAAYDGKIYAIAGETEEGVTNVVERYDPATDTWETLSPKPTAVTDVQAVVIGGEIFIPGGNEADGDVSSVLEIFDPSLETWIARAPLPEPLTRYAIVAYEGRMILFGGWNGEELIAKVYEYDPLDDTWEIIATLKEPRGDARAVVSGNQIYLLGGHDNDHLLKNLDLYIASAEVNGASRWTSLE